MKKLIASLVLSAVSASAFAAEDRSPWGFHVTGINPLDDYVIAVKYAPKYNDVAGCPTGAQEAARLDLLKFGNAYRAVELSLADTAIATSENPSSPDYKLEGRLVLDGCDEDGVPAIKAFQIRITN